MENTVACPDKLAIMIFGNPLLDISVEVSDNTILEKYGLTHGQASLCTPEQVQIYEDLLAMEGVQTIPGGSGLNSARAT